MKNKLLETINEVACLERYMQKYDITKTKLANDLKIKIQFISRVFTQKDRTNLPPALKFALLKYYYYDVETDTELGNSFKENVTKVYFYSYSPNEIKDEVFKSSEYIYFDKRWLTNILEVNPDDIFMYQLQEDDMENFYVPLIMPGRLRVDDIVMVDKSARSSSRRAFFLVKNNDKIQLKCLSMDWNGNNAIEYIYNHRREECEPFRREQEIDLRNIDILGKIVWNANIKMFR